MMEQFENVCNGLEELRNFADTKVHPIVSPENWGVYSDLCDLIDEFGTDALALIRQQQERIAELEAGDKSKPVKTSTNSYGHKFYYCPSCGRWFEFRKPAYCDQCGQKVKWE